MTTKTSIPDPLLHILMDTMTSCVRSDDPDLSGRQLTVFLRVCLLMPEGGHTVRGLAGEMNVSKPAITRALDRLSEFDLVRRKIDPQDRRSVLVSSTVTGSAYLRTLRGYMNDSKKRVDNGKTAEPLAA